MQVSCCKDKKSCRYFKEYTIIIYWKPINRIVFKGQLIIIRRTHVKTRKMNPQTNYFTTDLPGSQLQSKVIAFLWFPLIVAVVFIHSEVTSVAEVGDIPIYTYTRFLISNVIARIAVPLFFFISGYLFFNNCSSRFTSDNYIKKLKRRVRTLLVPYVFWNLVAILFYYIVQTFFPNMTSGNKIPIASYTTSDWIRAFCDIDGGCPLCYQFWFIRDLMVVMIFSPVVFVAIRHLKWIFVALLGILWFARIWFKIPGFSIDAFFFFSVGAAFKICNSNFLAVMKPYKTLSLVIYILLCILCLLSKEAPEFEYLQKASILIGIVFVITLTANCLKEGKWKVNPFLTESSFFIYAYHALVIALIIKIVSRIIIMDSDWKLLATYICAPLITIGVGLGIYYYLRKYFPKFTSVICGGR